MTRDDNRTVGWLLGEVGGVFSSALEERLPSNWLRPQDLALLMAVDANPDMPQQEIARLVRRPISSVSMILSDLEASGIVERHRSRHDHRVRAARLTERGRRLLNDGETIVRKTEDELLAPLGPDRSRALRTLLIDLLLAAERGLRPNLDVAEVD